MWAQCELCCVLHKHPGGVSPRPPPRVHTRRAGRQGPPTRCSAAAPTRAVLEARGVRCLRMHAGPLSKQRSVLAGHQPPGITRSRSSARKHSPPVRRDGSPCRWLGAELGRPGVGPAVCTCCLPGSCRLVSEPRGRERTRGGPRGNGPQRSVGRSGPSPRRTSGRLVSPGTAQPVRAQAFSCRCAPSRVCTSSRSKRHSTSDRRGM